MNNSLKLGFKLLLITSVTALALAFTNNMTKPIIEARQQEELKESLAVVYKADSYEELYPIFYILSIYDILTRML